MTRRYTYAWITFFCLFLFSLPVFSQNPSWTAVGPINFPINDIGQINGIGRVSQLKFDPVNATRMYAVAPHGVFVSNDTATTWNILPGTNNFPTATGCASICIDRTNNNTLYVGTGDANYYGTGSGVWKSTDGGNTFTLSNTGMGNALVIEILVSPTDANTLVAATNAGIYKTTNGGANWTLTSPVDQLTDMRMNTAAGSTTIYAISRTTQNFYLSTDMGSTWTTQNIGASTLGAGRIAVTPADPNVVYLAFIGSNSATGGGVIYQSTDGGVTFSLQKDDTTPNLVGYSPTQGGQGNYNFSIEGDPVNASTLYLCAHLIWKSTDAGVTWTQIQSSWAYVLHTDQHGLRFNPNNYNQLFNVNDGGVWINRDQASTNTWAPKGQGLAASEFYHYANSHSIKYLMDGGLQDNAEVYLNHLTNLWHGNRGGDFGSKIYWDYSGTNWAYYGTNGTRRNMQPYPANGATVSLGVPGTASNNDLYAFSYQDGNVGFYAQSNTTNIVYGLYSTANLQAAAPTWTQFSGFSPTTQMLAVSVSPADANILYVLSNNKSIVRSTNSLGGSPTFTTVTSAPQPSGTPSNGSFAVLKSGVVYMSADGYVFRSADQGGTWTAVGSGPITTTLNSQKVIKLIADTTHGANEVIYAATSSGIYYKDNTLSDWVYYTTSLPTTPRITDMDIFYDATNLSNSLLRISTYGRGIWEVLLASSTPNAPPVVSVTYPPNNSTLPAGSNITIKATASSPKVGGSISKVDFYQGSTLLGTSTTSPYSFTWNNVAAGSYVLTAKATDNGGLTTTSSPISIQVAGTTTILPPVADAYVRNGSYATSNFGTDPTLVVKSDGTSYFRESYLRFDYSAFTGSTVTNAQLKLYVSSVNTDPSRLVSIYGITDTTWGELTITYNNQPAEAGTFIGNDTINNTPGVWYSLDVTSYINSQLAGGHKIVSFRLINNGAAGGTNDVNFNSREASGNNPQLVLVPTSQPQPPTVSITSPANNATFAAGSNITINTTASSPNTGGSISKVDFYQGSTLLGTSTTSPYSFTWNNVAAGTYVLTAKATDNGGRTTTSAVVNIVVNAPPTVSVTSPANNANFAAGSNITINATASSPNTGGSISKVDFYQGSTLLGTSTTSPYSFTWSNVAAGNYALTAVATDNNGLTTTSAAVNIQVAGATTFTYGPVADAYVRDGYYANTNFGTAVTLDVKDDGTSYFREAYARFDYSAFKGSTIGSAQLKLYVSVVNTAPSRVVSVYGITDTTWGETTITYNNQPAQAGTFIGNDTISNTSGVWYTLDVTSYINSQLAGGHKIVTFRLINNGPVNGTNNVSFSSREAASNNPQLVLSTNTPPAMSVPPQPSNVQNASMQLFPNPANTAVTLKFNSHRAGNATVNIISVGDRRVMTKKVAIIEGTNHISVDIASLPQGLYIVEVMNGNGRNSQKLQIIR